MNKTKIEWTDYTWNPITGCWGPGGSEQDPNWCPYCYARKISLRFQSHFKPTLHLPRLIEPMKIKKPSRIFVCSMGEMFGDWVPREWLHCVLAVIHNQKRHTFQLLTKNPALLPQFVFSSNVWLGITMDGRTIFEPYWWLGDCEAKVRFISFEPLLKRIENLSDVFESTKANWVIIGGLTPRFPLFFNNEWVDEIIEEARSRNIPIFLKDNLKWHEKIQEFPTQQ